MELLHELLLAFSPQREAFFFMWFLAFMGVAALLVVIEKVLTLNRRTDYDAAVFFQKIKSLLEIKNYDDAISLCIAGKARALPQIIGAGIRKYKDEPAMAKNAMAEESIHITSIFERRLGLLVMFGNASTLMGLLGTVFGLIVSFAAIGKPGVEAIEKSSLLAAGISAAMNSTLVGLSISVPCVLVYAFLRARVDSALNEIERYSVAMINLISPPVVNRRGEGLSLMRRASEEEEAADTDVTPMLNLMVMLIPFLLTSTEFIKIGAIELKLPKTAAYGGEGNGGGGEEPQQEMKLNLGIVITTKGFTLYDYFKPEASSGTDEGAETKPDIPLKDGQFDYEALNDSLASIKQSVLSEIIKAYGQAPDASASLVELSRTVKEKGMGTQALFGDFESIKIVAEESISYQTVVGVMDAARLKRTDQGSVGLFPNVSIAGGIIQ